MISRIQRIFGADERLTLDSAEEGGSIESSGLVHRLDRADHPTILWLREFFRQSDDDVVRACNEGGLGEPFHGAPQTRVIETVLAAWMAVDVDEDPDPMVRGPLDGLFQVGILTMRQMCQFYLSA